MDHLDFKDIAIAADGSFAATRTQNGVLAGVAAQFTYTFSGQFNPTNVTGTLRQDVTFTDGSAYTCTTNDQSWSALRTAQGSQAAARRCPAATAARRRNTRATTSRSTSRPTASRSRT